MMESGRPSRTAFGAALLRAAHQILDLPPVFEDPLALRIVGPEGEALLRQADDPQAATMRAGLRAFLAVRSRFAEDCFAEAWARGVQQYVVLGAGLDTFAYRSLERFSGLRVFEIDHPATQAWKRVRLAASGIAVPDGVTFAPIDFERETLFGALARAGFNEGAPAFFAWLGVVPYLTHEAIRSTLGAVAALRQGSEIVFEYTEPESRWRANGTSGLSQWAERVAAAGEPLKDGFTPEAMTAMLTALGFSTHDDFDAEALNECYFKNRADGLHLRGHAHLIRARV